MSDLRRHNLLTDVVYFQCKFKSHLPVKSILFLSNTLCALGLPDLISRAHLASLMYKTIKEIDFHRTEIALNNKIRGIISLVNHLG